MENTGFVKDNVYKTIKMSELSVDDKYDNFTSENNGNNNDKLNSDKKQKFNDDIEKGKQSIYYYMDVAPDFHVL